MNRTVSKALLVCAVLTCAATITAQAYSITCGTSAGAGYSLSGAIGQPDAGRMAGDTYTIEGGFWGVMASIPPALSIACSGADIIVSWPLSATDYVLEETPTLTTSPIPWTRVSPPYTTNATHYSLTVPAPTGAKFYRLRKP
jgi:hypothetical protein